MAEIKIHSVIDLITNSSTEIFVKSENSLEPCKELINEFLLLMGEEKKCDVIFDIKVKVTESSLLELAEYIEQDDLPEELEEFIANANNHNEAISYNKRIKIIRDYLDDIYNNGKQKPDWFDDIEADLHIESRLVVIPKEEKYQKLVDLLVKFLYSPHYFEHSWG